jgi:hypothetical protein
MSRRDNIRALVALRMGSAEAIEEAFAEETSTEGGRTHIGGLVARALTCHPDDREMHAMRLLLRLEDIIRERIGINADDELPQEDEEEEG